MTIPDKRPKIVLPQIKLGELMNADSVKSGTIAAVLVMDDLESGIHAGFVSRFLLFINALLLCAHQSPSNS